MSGKRARKERKDELNRKVDEAIRRAEAQGRFGWDEHGRYYVLADVPPEAVTGPLDDDWIEDADDVKEAQEYVMYRIHENIRLTGHPLHHKAFTGVIVNPDVSLMAALAKLEAWVPTATPAQPDYYWNNPEGKKAMAAYFAQEDALRKERQAHGSD